MMKSIGGSRVGHEQHGKFNPLTRAGSGRQYINPDLVAATVAVIDALVCWNKVLFHDLDDLALDRLQREIEKALAPSFPAEVKTE